VINARYVGYFIPLNDIGIKTVAIAAIAALSAVNYYGVRQGSALQSAFTIVKIAAIALLVVAGFGLGGRVPEHFVGSSAAEIRVSDFLRAVGAGLFAFGGWHMVTYTAEETRQPTRTLPRALLLGMFIVILTYLALNTLYLYILPLDRVIASERVAADAADALLGSGGAALLAGLVIFSTIGALAGLILAGPRVYFAMAEDRLISRWVAAVHPRYQTPARAIVLQAIWASVLVATGSYRALFTRVIYTEWIFFALMAAGLLLARRKQDYTPAYRVWGFPILPVLFGLAALAVALNQIVADPGNSVLGLLLVLAGLPVYYFTVKRSTGVARARD
jgi:APA family basic amino acid/polyamine antiporter